MHISANRKIWRIAGPAMASNISAASVGLVDSWAVGHLDNPLDLAGLALAAIIMSLLLWSLGFLRMGTTGMVAQDFGARQRGRLYRTFMRALVLAVSLGGFMLLIVWPLTNAVLGVMAEGVEEAMIARSYLDIRLWALPAVLLKLVAVGTLIGLQRAKTALALEVFLNVSNAILTVVFVVYLGWGVEGAAWSSLIAEGSAGLAAVIALLTVFHPRPAKKIVTHKRFWRLQGFARLLAVNGYLFLRTIFLVTAFGLFVGVGDHLGADVVAGNHVLMNFVILIGLGLDGMAYAAEALVGEAVGARSRSDLSFWVRRTHFWALLLSIGYVVIFAIWGREIVDIFTHHENIRLEAYDVLLWLTILPLIGVWGYQYDGIFIGATAAKEMLITMALAFALYGVLLVFAVPRFGNHGLWFAFLVMNAVRGLGQAAIWPRVVKNIVGQDEYAGSSQSTVR